MPSPAFHPCVLIPTYNNPLTIAAVVADARRHVGDVLIVDDGSGDDGRAAVDALAKSGAARVTRRPRNGGKGAAVKTGFQAARDAGFTHALQIDADGQHDPADIPTLLRLAAARPAAAVLGHPIFDDSMPRGRRAAHGLTNFWTRVETGGPAVVDPQCGFRVYPLHAALAARARGDHMEFDIEIAVRLVWAGVPIINVPTRVRYLPAAAGGVSHFRPVGDNVAITLMHTRLVLGSLRWRLTRLWQRRKLLP
ncbi:MAG TPA: glycosyltransferase family 2 protein [Polyangia bacterium]|nr:glycosyltransferase family 2 protein [Polyangia bacterium]